MITRHIAWVPNPTYELLTTTGLLRFPLCVREHVVCMVPRALLAWLPFLAHQKLRVLMPMFTVN